MSRSRLGITLAWLFLPAALGLLQDGRIKTAGILVLGCLAAILLSGDRLAFLFSVAGLVLAVVSLKAVRRPAFVFACLLVLFVSAVLATRPDVYARQIASTADSIRNLGQTHYGVIWSRALVMARANPVFGVGMDLYRDVCADPK